jgi:hypothetical protein
MADLLLYGGGFARIFKTDPAEVSAAETGKWSPSTLDFQVSSAAAKGESAKDIDELLQKIAARKAGEIDELGIIGHSNSSVFALGGTIKIDPPDVIFNSKGANIDATELQTRQKAITAIRDRFSAKGKIVLYGCHAGMSDALLNEFSKAFGVCVHGFANEVQYCFTWDLKTRKITARGRSYYDNSPLAGVIRVDCANFNSDIRKLTPDKKSCAGVAAAASGGGS